jgi:hypothetical protein
MKLKSGVMFLAVLGVALATTPARAARINIGDQGGYVDPGVIAQTWARVTERGSADHSGPSYDIFFRRLRLYINAALNNNIGVIANTDISYTQGAVTTQSGVVTNPTTAQNAALRFHSPTIILNEALGYYKFCDEIIFMAGLQLIPWVHESFTDITKFSALDEQADVTERGRPTGFFGRDRDMGLAFRGDLAFINYRIGVFNGVQSAPGAAGVSPSGLVTGPANTAVNFPAYTGVNPGDSPSFDGFIRINIVGREPEYAFTGIANNGKSYFSIGGGANVQPRAVAAPTRGARGATYQGYFADLHMDLAFGDNEFVLEAGWVRTIYQGNGGAYSSIPTNATSLGIINNAGNGFYGSVGIRIAWIYPYFAMEDYQSNLNPLYVQSTYMQFGNGWLPAAGRVGNLQTYHGGLKFFISAPPGNQFMIDLDMAFQNKENAGTGTGATAINSNQWSGIVEFQWKI